jgi:hypothetical protein
MSASIASNGVLQVTIISIARNATDESFEGCVYISVQWNGSFNANSIYTTISMQIYFSPIIKVIFTLSDPIKLEYLYLTIAVHHTKTQSHHSKQKQQKQHALN